MAVRVAINGFGRIGRNVLRAIIESGRKDIEVVAINDLGPVETNAHLFRFDSVHGRFTARSRSTATRSMSAAARSRSPPSAIRPSCRTRRWASTSRWNAPASSPRKKAATAHLDAGAKRVLVSAPADNADLTVVYGVNHDKLTKDHVVVSNASCTTNCLAPVAKVLNDAVGIEHGFMTTIHAYTGDQPTLDTMHKDLYRGRAAALSMIPTSTGAAKAVGLVLPELNGKLDGVAIRVPTPNVSMIDFKFVAKRKTDKDEINKAVKLAAANQLKGILGWTDQPNVSIDFNHDQPFVDLPHGPDQGHGRHAGARHELVRQRVGLLQPHGRHGRGDGQAGLSPASHRSFEGRARASGAPFLFAKPPATFPRQAWASTRPFHRRVLARRLRPMPRGEGSRSCKR